MYFIYLFFLFFSFFFIKQYKNRSNSQELLGSLHRARMTKILHWIGLNWCLCQRNALREEQ